MKKAILISLLAPAAVFAQTPAITSTKTLWYDAPAKIWEECVPLGDGRMGMMPDGGIAKERIVLNEISMWSGSEFDYSNPEASTYLPQIRELLKEGKNVEAQQVMYEHFVPNKPDDKIYGSYQILANLNLTYGYKCDDIEPVDYSRGLDLSEGVAWTSFKLPNNVTYTRTYYTPRNEDGMLIKLSSSQPGNVNFSYTFTRRERGEISTEADGTLIIKGELDSGQPDVKGMLYCAATRVKVKGNSAKLQTTNNHITVTDADEVWIGISAATDFFYGKNYESFALQKLSDVLMDPQESVTRGIAAFQELMNRVDLTLDSNSNSLLPTDKRISVFQEDDTDAALAALYYNLGRYLLISSTKPGYLPPNLQGLWANTILTPWNGDYHTNINVQMNHWPAESGNLSELVLPLAELIKRSVPNGQRSAKAFYGDDADGWVMHMMTNVWKYTEPGENPSWGATNTGGAWMSQHLWDHYDYTGDVEFLSEYYPVLKGAAMFFLSTMINEPKHGWLVTAPSSSPENEFFTAYNDSVPVSVCMGPTMDTQLIGELWNNVIKADSVLGLNDPDVLRLQKALEQLPPMQIDSQGRLMEWLEEYKELDPKHRHVSHLYGLYPGYSISPDKTPELAEAARKTLDVRGDEGTGWSRAWKINFHARLLDGNRAWNVLKGLLQPAVSWETGRVHAGTFPNLFCSHAPFQIDGNFGGAAGIGEMLIQSHEGFLNLLPALPSNLENGKLSGYKTRGGQEIDIEWSNGSLSNAKIKGGYVENFKLKVPGNISKAKVKNSGRPLVIEEGGFINLQLKPDEIIELVFAN